MASEIQTLIERVPAWCKATLYALGQDLTRQPCQTWLSGTLERAELLEQIEEVALRRANVLGGNHAFLVELCDDGGTVLASEVFRVSAEVLPNGVSIAHEPANEGGLLAQLMRHNEANARTGVLQFQATSKATLEALNTISKHSQTVESKFTELMMRMQQLVLGEAETRVAIAREEGKQRSYNILAEKVGAVLPEVLGSMAGKLSGTPGAAAAIKAKGAFDTLTPQQLEHIMQVLDMPQKIALVGLLKTLAGETADAH